MVDCSLQPGYENMIASTSDSNLVSWAVYVLSYGATAIQLLSTMCEFGLAEKE